MTFVEPALWDHQKLGVQKMLEHLSFSLFFEQGTGKTLTTITALRHLFTKEKRALKTLILCPQIVIKNWESEFQRFSKMGDLVQPLVGKRQQRIALLEDPQKKIFVTNFEALDMEDLFWFRKPGKKTKLARALGFEVLIVDESHRFKDGKAERTKVGIKMADKIPRVHLLTGTPILNGPMDIWSQYRILDAGATFGENFIAFRSEYFVDKNAGKPAPVYFPDWRPKPGIEEELNEKMYKKAMRVLKSECLDLPPLVAKRVSVGLSSEQEKHYESMLKDYITTIKDKACTAQIALTRALRLMQITSGFLVFEDGTEKPLADNPRLDALEELLRDICPAEKVIVWATFKNNYKDIQKLCDKLKLKYAMLTGEQSAKEKQASVEALKGDINVLIANPAAGGTGVNLVEASTAIFYSRNFDLGQRLQAQARNYRGGSDVHAKITQIDLVTEGTID